MGRRLRTNEDMISCMALFTEVIKRVDHRTKMHMYEDMVAIDVTWDGAQLNGWQR